MDPELIAQLLAAQDATGAPPRAPQTGRGRTFLQLLRDGANAFGEATLGRALTLGTADPSLPETQEAYRSALGFTADFVPGVGDIKAALHDAPALFAEGHPVLGALAAASALPILGAPLDAARKTLRVRHHGPQVQDLDVLDPAFAGTGLRGSERQMQAAFPDEYEPGTYFYIGDQPAEPGLRGRPSVELDLPAEKFADPQQFQPFLEQAREQLVAEGRAVVPDLQFLRAQRLLKQSGEFEGYYDPQRGVLVKLTPTELPRGAANRAISEATSRNIPGSNTGGATFTLDGEDLLGTPNYAVAVRPGNDLTVPATADGGVARGDLNRFRERFSDDLTDPDHHVGTWRRDATPVEVAEGLAGPNGQVVDLDVVRAVPKREEGARWEAIRQGLQNEQKAIFDLENIEEIQLAPRDRTARQQAADRASRTSEANLAQRTAEIETGLTDTELDYFNNAAPSNVRANIIKNYARLPTPQDFAQAAIRGAEQRGWYRESGEAIKETFGDDAGRFTALLAATSPNKSVTDNVRIATEIWADWVQAGRPVDERAITQIVDNIANLDADKGNAIRSLTAAEETVQAGDFAFISGPKVEPFARNLFGEVLPVVNDTWMAKAYGTGKGGVGTIGRGMAQNAMVRNAAAEFENITGTAVEPREIQEMVWTFVRGLGETQRGRPVTEVLEESFTNPEVLARMNEKIAEADPISNMLLQPEFAANLQRAGLTPPGSRNLPGTPGVDPMSADLNSLRDIAQRMDASQKKAFYSVLLATSGAALADHVFPELRENR